MSQPEHPRAPFVASSPGSVRQSTTSFVFARFRGRSSPAPRCSSARESRLATVAAARACVASGVAARAGCSHLSIWSVAARSRRCSTRSARSDGRRSGRSRLLHLLTAVEVVRGLNHHDNLPLSCLLLVRSLAQTSAGAVATRVARLHGQPSAMPSAPLDGLGSGRRIIRNELNRPMSPARIGTSSAT